MRTTTRAHQTAGLYRGYFGWKGAPDPDACAGTLKEAPVRKVHLGIGLRPRRSMTGRTATHTSGDLGGQQAGPKGARERRDGNVRRRNAGGTTGGVGDYGGCGCMWTARRRRWTNANLEFQNLSHIVDF